MPFLRWKTLTEPTTRPVMMLPLVVVGCTSKQSVSQCVKPPPPPAWIMQPPPDWQTPLNGIISPSERG
ncbi:hypothetical protein EBP73_12145 [Escherichia coli O5]|nr:hypothetical protein [Escherichia coli O5]